MWPSACLDPWWLPKRRCVQVGEDLLDQGGVIAAAGPLQQRHHPTTGQLAAAAGVGTAASTVIAALCLRFGNACNACG